MISSGGTATLGLYDLKSKLDVVDANKVIDVSGKTQQEINNQLMVRTYYIEDFGAAKTKTPLENSAAIRSAFLALKSNDTLLQAADIIEIDRTDCGLPVAIFSTTIHLNLKYSGTGSASQAAVFISKVKDSLINISVDGSNKNLRLLQCNECTDSVIPTSSVLQNSYGTTSLVTGLFTRDSDNMNIVCKVRNISTDGTQVVRGVMISDQTIKQNTSYIAPNIDGVTHPVDAVLKDADGLYAEHTNSDHTGGLRIQNGNYKNCSKRFIKVTMLNPTITGNTGKNDNPNSEMYSFVSVYADNAGIFSDNNFEVKGSSTYGIDFGVSALDRVSAQIGKNLMKTLTKRADSYAYRINSPIGNIDMDVGNCEGFAGLFSQMNAATASNQSLSITSGFFDSKGNSDARNCIALLGNYSKFSVRNVSAPNPVASRYFVSAPDISDNIAVIDGNTHSYSFGTWQSVTNRPNILIDKTAVQIRNAKLITQRNNLPTSGTYRVGDIVEHTTPAKFLGWVCTKAGVGIGATWEQYGVIQLQKTQVYDPPSIAAGGSTSLTVTLLGAVVGDFVNAGFSVYSANIRISAVVSEADTVVVTFQNIGASAVDLQSGSLVVKLI